MALNYKRIAEEHRELYGSGTKHLRIFKKLFDDKTHFVYELIQNADDSRSKHLELQLRENELLVCNDGRQFTEKDVRSICSLGSSDKDLTHIGTFGIGFKAVYNYTDFPEIYSNDEHFRIRNFVKPEGIDDIIPEIAKVVSEGKTIFCLPFKNSLHQDDIDRLKNRLCNLSKERSLLFLRHLETVEWKDKHNVQTGSYSCHRHPFEKIQNVSENEAVELVKLIASLNGNVEAQETFLVFHKKVCLPKNVIDQLLEQAEDEEERQRIQQSKGKLQPIEVAFKLQDDRIAAMDDNCVLFAYLPTRKETHLKFLIQSRYQTTPARDNIPKPSENPWNRWLLQEAANFLPEVLKQLKDSGLLEPVFFNVLPLKEDNIPEEFELIVEALQKAMQEKAFVPTEKEGHYAKAANVFYPDSKTLRELIKSSGMHPNSSLLHLDIQNNESFGRCFKVMRKAGVKIVGIGRFLSWLDEQSIKWFEARSNEWLRSLYNYLKDQESELERIKKLPLVRLENGVHVCASDQLVYFPPDTDEERQEIEPFLNELPILQSTFLKGQDHNDFLEDIGVQELHPENLIDKSIYPLYSQPNKPPIMKNRWHVRYIFKFWQKATESERGELKKSVSKVPILRAYEGIQREISDFVVPCNAYLPQAYTGDDDLETYFSVSNGDLWFVDDKYLTNKSDTKAWLQFLKAIGAMDTPQITDVELPGSGEECKKRGITYENSTKPFEDGKFKDIYRRPYQYFDGHIVDHNFDGLTEVLGQLGNHNGMEFSKALWGLLVKLVSSLPSEEWRQNAFFRDFFQGTYHWSYNGPKRKSFDAAFYHQLKETAWLPDEQGKLRCPSKCFAPTSKNQEILGDSVTYLHSDFDISTRPARWLAGKLGMHLQADVDGVLDYLQTLSQTETSIEKIGPIYEFLWSEDEHLWRFKEKSLIFTPEPEPRWWRTDEVFWEDESAVFGKDRGYLKAHYSEDLRSFFINSLEARERADTVDYVRGIQDITSKGQAETEEVRNRVQGLYRRLWLCLQEKEDGQEDEGWQEEWAQVREDACWLGKKGDEWGFFSPQKLVWNDHPYRAKIFEGEVPFWEFSDELLELARDSGIKGCSQASVECLPFGYQEDDKVWSRKVQDLRSCIEAFLKSSSLCDRSVNGKSAEVLSELSVRRVEELEVTYELNDSSVIDIEARQSFLSETNQGVMLWLALETKEDEYAELIGDALQDYFGVKELRGFVEDLLTKDRDRVLTRWKRDGLRVDLCESTPGMDCKESEEIPSESVDGKVPDQTGNADDSGTNESENETPVGDEDSETGDEDSSSIGGEFDTPPRRPRPGGGGARWRGGSGSGKPNRSGGPGYGGRGGGEGEKHRSLKEYLAANPSLFGEGLELIDTEYRFGSGDEADILFEDSSGNPVTVEVKPPILSGSDQEVWQAVKYKHLAAVEYNLPCEQIRSILAAPEIPDDVKSECERLGIDPIEVSYRD